MAQGLKYSLQGSRIGARLRTEAKQSSYTHCPDSVRLQVQSTLPTPVVFTRLKPFLRGYPPEKVNYLEKGFSEGFSIEYQGEPSVGPVNVVNPQMHNCLQGLLLSKIRSEVLRGTMAGPFDHQPFHPFRCSPVRLEPKKSGHYRIIHNLSHPFASPLSVNSAIPPESKRVTYATLDDAIKSLKGIGVSAFMAKTDVKSAFNIIPVKPGEYHLLGFTFQGKYFYAKTLPMGAASSCAIFERFSTALQYAATNSLGVYSCVHVLDDFLFMAPTEDRCRRDLEAFMAMCASAGIPIALDKTVGPAQVIEFLGITVNAREQYSELPQDKVQSCRSQLSEVRSRSKSTLLQLQTLLGHLNFACRVVIPARPFLSATYALSRKLYRPHHKARLTELVKEDLVIWEEFLSSFNGVSFFLQDLVNSDPDLHLYTDASTTVGFGACLKKEWTCGRWAGVWTGKDILVLETYPVLLALAIWGPTWQTNRLSST